MTRSVEVISRARLRLLTWTQIFSGASPKASMREEPIGGPKGSLSIWPKGGGQMREGHIADVYTVHDGKIVQMQAYGDPEEARKAVGLSPHRDC